MTRSPADYVAASWGTLAERDRPLLADAQARLEAWVARTGASPCRRRGYSCLGKLGNPRHSCGRAYVGAFCDGGMYWPQVLDHAEWWRGPAGEYILTAHPYRERVEPEDLAALARIADRTGATVSSDLVGSWYFPGRTILIQLWGRSEVRRGA